MTEMSLKKIMQKVNEEKAKRGTNVLGESRPLGSLQRSILSTRAFRAQNRQQMLDEAKAAEAEDQIDEEIDGEELDEKSKQQLSRLRKRRRMKRRGKRKDPKRVKAAQRAARKMPSGARALASKKRLKTMKTLGQLKSSADYALEQYQAALNEADEDIRSEFLEAIEEVGFDSFMEYVEDQLQIESKCQEMYDDEDDEDDEDEVEEKCKKHKKESTEDPVEETDPIQEAIDASGDEVELDEAAPAAHVNKMMKMAPQKSPERDQYFAFIDLLSGKKVSKEDLAQPGAKKAAADYKKLKKSMKEALDKFEAAPEDPIEEMLVGSDENDQVDPHEHNPLAVGQKTADVKSGDQVVGRDPKANAKGKVQNAKGDKPEYKDKNHSPGYGQDRGQPAGYGY